MNLRGAPMCVLAWCLISPIALAQEANQKPPRTPQELLSRAKEERIVNLRMQTQPVGTEKKLEELFSRQFGFPVTVEIFAQHPVQAQPALIQESRAGKISSDLFYGADTVVPPVLQAGGLQEKIDWVGLVGPLLSPAGSKRLKQIVAEIEADSPSLAHSCLRWQDIYYAIVYNSEVLDRKSVPRTFDGLLDPKFKGKVAWMASAYPIGEIANVFGDAYALQYARRLKDNGVILVPGGSAGVAEAVASGQAAIGVGGQNLALMKRADGAPIDAITTNPVVGFDFNLCVLKGPHPNLGVLFTAWLAAEARSEFLGPPWYYTRLSDTAGPLAEVLKLDGFTMDQFKVVRNPAVLAQGEALRQKVLKEIWAN
jgi:ABC-type Fe3+ transport system substrate-binding protein